MDFEREVESLKLLLGQLEALKHPFPLGAIARSYAISKLNPGYEGKRDQNGMFGLRKVHYGFTAGGPTTDMVVQLQALSITDNVGYLENDGHIDKAHVQFSWNSSIAKQKRWGKSVRDFLRMVHSTEAKMKEALGIDPIDKEAELPKDKVDQQRINIFNGTEGVTERRQNPPTMMENLLFADRTEFGYLDDIEKLKMNSLITDDEVAQILSGHTIDETRQRHEEAVIHLMKILERI